MIIMSSENDTLHGTQVLIQQRFNQALALEKQLCSLIESKGSLGLNVRDLRLKIREIYGNIVLEDHEFAEGHEVEQALWRLHYKQIDEFRIRIRLSLAANSGPNIPMPGAKHVPRNEPVHKVLASFRSFLSEATGFYHELILKLRAKHGLPHDFFSTEGVSCANNQKTAVDLKRCQLSCHRCLIYLGDLARYKECHGDGDSPNHDWSIAARYYLKAVSLWPSSGNPHNQLAVLATYVGDELLALYRYFRSLAVETPFVTAKENLMLLFDKNRSHYHQLSAYANESNSQASKNVDNSKTKYDITLSIGDGLKLAIKDHGKHNAEEGAVSISELRKWFRVRFVRLNGILFTRTSLETFPEVYAASICDLEQLLSLDDMSLEAGLGSEHRSGIGTGSSGAAGVLQLVCILIFTVHNANGTNTMQQPTYADVLQRSALLQNAPTAAFECTGRLMRRCADSKNISSSPFLPAMLVFLEWLVCRKEIAVANEDDEKQKNARSFFWKQCVEVLNKLYRSKDLDSETGNNTADMLEMPNEFVIPLWEDYELQGFGPLVPAQRGLDYSISSVRVGFREKKEQQVRVHRLLAAGKAIGIAFEGTGRGISYDEETRSFCLGGELKGKSKNDLTSADGQMMAKQAVECYLNSAARNSGSIDGCKENKPATKDVCAKSVNVDEDDGEYIVFKPVPKDLSTTNTAHNSTSGECGEASFSAPNISQSNTSSVFQGKIGLDKLEISSVSKDHPPGSFLPNTGLQVQGGFRALEPPVPLSQALTGCGSKDHPPGSFLPNTGLQVQGGLRALDPPVPLSQALTGFPSAASSVMSLLVRTPTSLGVPADGEVSSVQQELKLNRQSSLGESLCVFPSPTLSSWGIQNHDVMLTSGMVKSNPLGVIGQQKQADMSLSYWNTQVDVPSLARLSGLSSSDSSPTQSASENYCLPTNYMRFTSQSDRIQQSGVPSTFLMDSSFSVRRPHPSAPLLPEESDINTSGDITSSTQYFNQKRNAITEAKDTNLAISIPLEYSDLRKESLKTSIGGSQLVTQDNTDARWMRSPAIGPPPGFGPTQFISGKSDEDGETPHPVDDYAWLDGYTSSAMSESNKGRYRDWSLPNYSSGNGIWTSGDKLPVSPDSTSFPFPGMGFSGYHHADDQQQKQCIESQFYEQALHDHQSKWFEYGVESTSLQFGSLPSLYEAQQQSESQKQLRLLQEKQQEWYRPYQMGGPFAS